MITQEQYKQRARKVKIRMFEKGLTQAEVTRRLDLTTTHVSLCLNGKRVSSRLLDTIEAMLDEMEDPEPSYAIA